MTRVNQFVAQATGVSRRAADKLIDNQKILINDDFAIMGQNVGEKDTVKLDGRVLHLPQTTTTIMLNKPIGYVCSRDGQGSKTIYDLLPPEFHNLKPIGRLDKNSSGLLLLTNNGKLAHQLTHPSFEKEKIYEVELNKPLSENDKNKIEQGVKLEDGLSKMNLSGQGKTWNVKIHEGRNRQIRRTFAALGYKTIKLHRTTFGDYKLNDLKPANFYKI